MDIQLNKINPNHGVISITLCEADYKSAVEKQLRLHAQNVRLKGFRLGAVPQGLVKRMHGASILTEELHKAANAALKHYIIEERIPVFMQPLLVTPLQEIDLKNERTFTFSYEVGLMDEGPIVFGPDISIIQFEIERIGSKLVDEFLQALQIVHGEAADLEESAPDAILYGTLTNSTGAVGLDIRISIMHVPEHLREALVGLRVGQKVALTQEMLANHFSALLDVTSSQLAIFKRYESAWPATFTIDEIVRVVPATIEPTLFDLVLGKGVANSESEFREAIAKIILFDKQREARYAFYEDLKQVLLKCNVVNLPEAFLKKWLIANNPEATLEQVEEYYRTNEESFKWEVLLTTILSQNDLGITASDIVDQTKRAYIDYANRNGLALEEDDDEEIHASALSFLQGNEGNKYYAKLYRHMAKDKVISFIKEQITVITEKVTGEEFDARR